MRIVAGRHRGRALAAPPGAAIRPTADRAREGLFNRLAHGSHGAGGVSPLVDAVVLDAFCGTGALGLEALSRGAARALFLDASEAALAAARANARALGETARCRFYRLDATAPGRAPETATLAFLDPPYDKALAAPALAALAAGLWLAPGALACVEIAAGAGDFAPPAGFTTLDDRRYGKARSLILRFGAKTG